MSTNVDSYLERLFPITRSITGEGNRETLNILDEITPLKIKSIPSNTEVFDWTVPPEWSVREAWIKDSKGKTLVDYKDCNIHLMSYSTPVEQAVDFDELSDHLHYLEDKPTAIPYRTSYYKRDWGFCMTHDQYSSLDRDDTYSVFIDSNFNDRGELIYGEAFIKGQTDEEILISSYMCHPSLANDNLSGIVLSCLLFKKLSELKNTRYSYRLLILPETIGPIAWLASEKDHENVVAGFVVSCVAGPGELGYKETYLGDHFLDKAVKYALHDKTYIHYGFEPIGSDERQYSSPKFRIPIGTITKSKYYEYEEYHTSLDNLNFISSSYLEDTLVVYLKAIHYLEHNKQYSRKFDECEFRLSKLGDLYPSVGGTISQPTITKKQHANNKKRLLDCISWLMFACDGENSLFDVQEMSKLSMDDIIDAAKILEGKGILL